MDAAAWPGRGAVAKLPGGGMKSAGPFYIVWQSRSDAGISTEYWVYHLASLTITDSPAKRWPGLAVGADVPAADPARRGLDRFVTVCMACHRFAGEGEGTQGPDLAWPMNPVDYFQPTALRTFLRDPRSVRAWAEQKMPAFNEEQCPTPTSMPSWHGSPTRPENAEVELLTFAPDLTAQRKKRERRAPSGGSSRQRLPRGLPPVCVAHGPRELPPFSAADRKWLRHGRQSRQSRLSRMAAFNANALMSTNPWSSRLSIFVI